MKKIVYILSFMTLAGCNIDEVLNCFETSGDIVQREIDIDAFKDIIVFHRVELIVSQGPTQRVVVETGEKLLDDINVRVEDSILKISDRNGCNLVRDFTLTKVYVTSPEVRVIRNSSGFMVKSQGVLRFDDLTLLSEDRVIEGEFRTDGDFDMDLDVRILSVRANGLSKFCLRGETEFLSIRIFDSDARIEAGDLTAEGVLVFHRGTNKIIVNPQRTIRGEIASLGDVIAKTRPPIVEVEELFTGRLIFE